MFYSELFPKPYRARKNYFTHQQSEKDTHGGTGWRGEGRRLLRVLTNSCCPSPRTREHPVILTMRSPVVGEQTDRPVIFSLNNSGSDKRKALDDDDDGDKEDGDDDDAGRCQWAGV